MAIAARNFPLDCSYLLVHRWFQAGSLKTSLMTCGSLGECSMTDKNNLRRSLLMRADGNRPLKAENAQAMTAGSETRFDGACRLRNVGRSARIVRDRR